jgi:hypothetical protein
MNCNGLVWIVELSSYPSIFQGCIGVRNVKHLQVFIGSATPVLSLPFTSYQKWVEINWVTSIWWFTSSLGIIFDVEDQWIPHLARQNDQMIMDMALTFNFNPTQYHQINSCRI